MSEAKPATTMSKDFKITVPVDVCESMGLRGDQKIKFITGGNGVLLEPQPFEAKALRARKITKQA